jgi:hypothetical protein
VHFMLADTFEVEDCKHGRILRNLTYSETSAPNFIQDGRDEPIIRLPSLEFARYHPRVMGSIIFTVYDRPGLENSPAENSSLVEELKRLASLSLNPLPNYQCFSSASNALDDKVIVTAHSKVRNDNGTSGKGSLIAFTSAVLLKVVGLDGGEVFHTGLTVVDPLVRRQGLLVQLFSQLILHVYSSRSTEDRIWITSLAEIPNSLVHVAIFMANVFPSPFLSSPNATHLLIARSIDKEHRKKMLISPNAVFDEEHFVFKGSNDSEEGNVFLKNADDPQYWHRNRELNDYYRSLLQNKGDEVLQVRKRK